MPISPEALIWVTRPLPAARRTAEAMATLGLTPLVAPLLSIHPLPAELPPERPWPQGWIFTSQHAPPALVPLLMRNPRAVAALEALRALPAWCVGARTAEAALAAGFLRAQCLGEEAVAMVRRLGPRLEALRGDASAAYVLWYAAGKQRRHDLQALLSPWNLSVRTLALYDSRPAAHLPEEAAAALRAGRLRAVLLYSPETARAFGRVMERAEQREALADLPLFCLSAAVAAALPTECHHRIIAPAPTEAALLQSLDAWAKTA